MLLSNKLHEFISNNTNNHQCRFFFRFIDKIHKRVRYCFQRKQKKNRLNSKAFNNFEFQHSTSIWTFLIITCLRLAANVRKIPLSQNKKNFWTNRLTCWNSNNTNRTEKTREKWIENKNWATATFTLTSNWSICLRFTNGNAALSANETCEYSKKQTK